MDVGFVLKDCYDFHVNLCYVTYQKNITPVTKSNKYSHIEEIVGIPVTLVRTGANHDEIIDLDL